MKLWDHNIGFGIMDTLSLSFYSQGTAAHHVEPLVLRVVEYFNSNDIPDPL